VTRSAAASSHLIGSLPALALAILLAAYESQFYGACPGGPPLVYNIQVSLTRLGYEPGAVDGVYGERTADAISRYQDANRLPVDGQPSPQLLNLMISQGG
jgi:peptidoglycan hydrolase-like protein with peptidoglycan-binding domain